MNEKHFSNELKIFEATEKSPKIKPLFNSLKNIPPSFVELIEQ